MSVLQTYCSDFCLSHDLFCSFPKWAGRGGEGKRPGPQRGEAAAVPAGPGWGGGRENRCPGVCAGQVVLGRDGVPVTSLL